MPCLPLLDHRGKRVGTICGWEPVYRFRGFLFEVHHYCGPMPLKKNMEPRVNIPAGFWDAWEVFTKLPPSKQGRYAVER